MSWSQLGETQEKVVKILTNSLRKNRLSHAYVFDGGKGTGKKRVAVELAKSFLCKKTTENQPCQTCLDCKRIDSGNHPDVHIIKPEGQTIKVEQIRNLQKEFSYRGMESTKKVYIIEDVEKMSTSAANSLLKFLEEPDGSSVAILLTAQIQKLLKTILSRVQIISFAPLNPIQLVKRLEEIDIPKPLSKLLTQLTNDFDEAYELYQDDWIAQARNIVIQLEEELCSRPQQAFITLQEIWFNHFKERDQLNLGLDLLLLWYRDILRTLILDKDQLVFIDQLDRLERLALNSSQRKISQQMSSILEAKRRLSANVNPQLLMEQLVLKLQEG